MKHATPFKLKGRKFEAVKTRPQKELAGLGAVHCLIHVDSRYKFVKAGTIVSEADHKFLLATHHSLKGFNVFNCITITGTAVLKTTKTTLHPVTGLPEGRVVEEETPIDVVYSPMKDKTDENLKVSRARYFLGQKVTTSDSIDGKRVKLVNKVLGVYIVETA